MVTLCLRNTRIHLNILCLIVIICTKFRYKCVKFFKQSAMLDFWRKKCGYHGNARLCVIQRVYFALSTMKHHTHQI